MSESDELMGCIACMGERKKWCPIHGDGSPVPEGDGEAELGALIANRDKDGRCVMCGSEPIPLAIGWYCSNPECGYGVGVDADFVQAVFKEMGAIPIEEREDFVFGKDYDGIGIGEMHDICDAVLKVLANRRPTDAKCHD